MIYIDVFLAEDQFVSKLCFVERNFLFLAEI